MIRLTGLIKVGSLLDIASKIPFAIATKTPCDRTRDGGVM
jgi:hypothetical protein